MICNRHIYGIILNDKAELVRLAPSFAEKPYLAPPVAPVIFMKPATALTGGTVGVKPGEQVVAAATLALLIARDTTRVDADHAMDCVGATALAIDISYPQVNYYRPAIAQRNADGFLVLGEWGWPTVPDAITTTIDDQPGHRWSLDRLARPIPQLIADISAYLTLQAGDVLMVGLPGDAPAIRAGVAVCAQAPGLGAATARIEELVQ